MALEDFLAVKKIVFNIKKNQLKISIHCTHSPKKPIEMRVTERKESCINVYFKHRDLKRRLILEIVDEGYIDVYDYVNDVHIIVKNTLLCGVLDEVEPYINVIMDGLEKNPSNVNRDSDRKYVLENVKKKKLEL